MDCFHVSLVMQTIPLTWAKFDPASMSMKQIKLSNKKVGEMLSILLL